jgi:predicted DNA binding CopG/RHH family protein
MKKIVLSKEEKEIEKNSNKFSTVSKSRKNQIDKMLKESKKSRSISLRINEQDLNTLKIKAEKNGLPYQTMINVIIRKFVNDSFLDKDEIDKYLRLKKAG